MPTSINTPYQVYNLETSIHDYLRVYGELIYEALDHNLPAMRDAYGEVPANIWFNTVHTI